MRHGADPSLVVAGHEGRPVPRLLAGDQEEADTNGSRRPGDVPPGCSTHRDRRALPALSPVLSAAGTTTATDREGHTGSGGIWTGLGKVFQYEPRIIFIPLRYAVLRLGHLA